MPQIEKKQVIVQEIKEKLAKASSIVLVDARGVTVEQDTILRRKMREEGIDYKVYKNSLIGFAVEGTEFADIAPYLAGPTTLAISYGDATAAARVISKELKAMPKLEFKAGVIEKTVYDAAGVTAIANIPSREELLGRLLGSLKSPMASFARVINAIAEEGGGGAATVNEAPAAEEVVAVAEEAAVEEPVAVAEEAAAEEVAAEEPVAVAEEATAEEATAAAEEFVAGESATEEDAINVENKEE
jgi:large subunit ribosomal protein L10